MKSFEITRGVAIGALLCSLWIGSPAGADRRQLDFLTPAAPGPPLEIALDYLFDEPQALALRRVDLEEFFVADQYRSAHNGVTHIVLRQRIHGIEVWNGDIGVNLSRDGRLINARNRFVPRAQRVSGAQRTPLLSAEDAVRRAAEELGQAASGPLVLLERQGGPSRKRVFRGGGLSRDPIPVRLMYQAGGPNGVRLVWNLVVRAASGLHWWDLNIDARTGELLSKVDWVRSAAYRVYPLPLQHPDDGPRSLLVDPVDFTASPYGWHDDDGSQGAEFTDTRGNNVLAQEDANANDRGGFRPSGGSDLVFDFPIDLSQQPSAYQAAAITNLFYWNNVLHDIHYRYGFDEASGNFQRNNYGRGGRNDDPVLSDAQDGEGTNNASFATPPDGQSPRMSMLLWFTPVAANLRVASPASIAGNYPAGDAEFGPGLTGQGITGTVVRALDPLEPEPGFTETDACSELTNADAVAGNIALVDRGECFFVEKLVNVQNAGAIAAIVVNNQGDEVIRMGGSDPSIVIPSLFIGQSDGDRIKSELDTGVIATLSLASDVPRDSSVDNGTIIHEYGHGVTMRLTGGPSNVNCLSLRQSAGMGEGWSDFWEIALTAMETDERDGVYPVGTFLAGQHPTGRGIRNFPYSTDLGINPQTYGDIATTNAPHGIGEVWASALWEVYWNLLDDHGFDSNLYTGSGGNNLMLQLVTDALKLQPCEPSFLDGRDNILLADRVLTGGANECAIWEGFAKRGMGVDADDGGSALSLAVVENFDPPVLCPEPSELALQLAALGTLAILVRKRRIEKW